jgi:4-diphosphocytidyl-2-C-methyl-D-erythritol kinase
MIVFPQAKINLGLNILGKRSDGFHDLQSVFISVNLKDVLEVILDPNLAIGKVEFTTSGIPIPGNSDSNLILKAAHYYHELIPIPGMRVHLHKNIPMGAGMGGGSSNGAWMLRLINELMGNALEFNQLLELASRLGSDCPFFLFDTPCFVTGRGEVIEPITLDLKGLHLVLINPGIHISTAEAFRMIKPQPNYTSLKEALRMPANEWQQYLKNDFEDPACALYPEIGKTLHTLNEAGAIYSSMTGSGSTVYGLFSKKPVLAECPSHWFIHGSTF